MVILLSPLYVSARLKKKEKKSDSRMTHVGFPSKCVPRQATNASLFEEGAGKRPRIVEQKIRIYDPYKECTKQQEAEG